MPIEGGYLASKQFTLKASVSSDNPSAVKTVIEKVIGTTGTVSQKADLLEINAVLEGESARELNRTLLSEMRRAEKKTRMRSEWSSGNTVESFFDYVPKGSHRME